MSNQKKSRKETASDKSDKLAELEAKMQELAEWEAKMKELAEWEAKMKDMQQFQEENMERLESQCREVALSNQEQKRLIKKLVKSVQEDCITVHGHAEAIFESLAILGLVRFMLEL